MNDAMVANYNAVIQPSDLCYHLGDFAMGSATGILEFRQKLNGRICLIKGNHDRSKNQMLRFGFDEVHTVLEIELDGIKLYMAHHPPQNGVNDYWKAKADIRLCGHVHDKWARRGNVINVGVDVRNFRPVTLKELLATPV